MIPVVDYDSDLRTGSRIDFADPPQHCGHPMEATEEHGGYQLTCVEDDYEIHTDERGVLTEPPHITRH